MLKIKPNEISQVLPPAKQLADLRIHPDAMKCFKFVCDNGHIVVDDAIFKLKIIQLIGKFMRASLK